MDKPLNEQTYGDETVSTFFKRPTVDIAEHWALFESGTTVLDAGCGEGRNAIFLAEKGLVVDAFDISWTGLEKARQIAADKGVNVNLFREDLAKLAFRKTYGVILSHGVLHLCEKAARDLFLERAMKHTLIGGHNAIGIFTNKLPTTPEMAPFAKSLFDVGELPAKYAKWEILHHFEGIIEDSRGGKLHKRGYESIIARKIGN
ncbi:MAG: methyltransferase domain-containing protein [Clostridiales bacterium]|jgi:tellurite methyltransferase|nr:methyltransferase domain-containing protein [Clostridiales bacterium]